MKQFQNRLDELKTEIENKNAKMNILMKKLSDVVYQSTSYEKDVLHKISLNYGNLSAALNMFPNLKSNLIFIQYFNEVSNLETEIQTKLSEYNSIIKMYNDKINNFPDMILALIFSFRKRNYAKRQ